MMRTSVGLRLAMALAALATLAPATPAGSTVGAQVPVPSEQQPAELFTVDELDNLLAPIALYPDPILAQVLVAATYPDQIALAARYVRTYGAQDIDRQGWDVSVKAVAHYLPVLNLLAEREDWTTALGQAYALQPGDVMASVQGLREMAHQQGNLVSTAEQRVEYAPQEIRIVPAQPRVIYVPTYDPEVVYYRPVYYARRPTTYWSFGIAFPIGVWLSYDVDWGHRNVYYHGWHGYGRQHTWYHVSRPFISINTIYVNPRRTVVVINRNVVHRRVTYVNFNRYNTVHRTVAWDRRGLPGRNGGQVTRAGGWNDDPRGGERGGDRGYDRGTAVPRNGPTRGGGNDVATSKPAPKSAPTTNRVTPTRIGGNNRPLYPTTGGTGTRSAQPRSAPDLTPPRTSASQGVAPRSGSAPARTGGAASPRTAPARAGASPAPSRAGGTYSAPSRGGTYSAPVTTRKPSAAPSASGSRSAPRAAPRAAAPRAAAPRTAPPRASAPAKAPPKASPKASSKPSSAKGSSAPAKGSAKARPRGN